MDQQKIQKRTSLSGFDRIVENSSHQVHQMSLRDLSSPVNHDIQNNFEQELPQLQMKKRKSSFEEIIPYIGIDIGGTLAKVCIAFKKGKKIEFKHIEHLMIKTHKHFDIYFEVFPSNDMDKLIGFIQNQEIQKFTKQFYISGGGAHKFQKQFEDRLGVTVIQVAEMQSLSYGLKLLDMLLPNNSAYHYDFDKKKIQFDDQSNWMFPLMLVQIGSGVSILKVKSQDEFERVSGTSLGGNMFLGIAHLLTGIHDFDKVLDMTVQGNNKATDLFVSDIYHQFANIPDDILGDTLCVSFGKIKQSYQEGKQISKEDLLKSALQMVAFNVCQISFLLARIHKIDNMFFTGYFIKNHEPTIECIEQAIQYFSKTQNQNKQAYFLKHDGFLGALGSFYSAVHEKHLDEDQINKNQPPQTIDLTQE